MRLPELPSTPAVARLRARLERGDTVDLRGDGKAGGGLVLAVQAFGQALGAAGYDVQDWPLFSSARKGANVRAFLRVGSGRVETACQIAAPDVVLLMNVAAAEECDFAEGTAEALYVVNTPEAPAAVAARFRLGGTVATVDGDALGRRFLERPLGNVAVFAALVRETGLVGRDVARASLAGALGKRRLPERLVTANLALFDAAWDAVRVCNAASAPDSDHRRAPFRGYGALPVGAQAALRSSVHNRTAGYGRPGITVTFADPTSRCNGCSLCVAQCPDGILLYDKDPKRGAVVRGGRFGEFCKVCGECVAACPLDLFEEVEIVAAPREVG